MRVLVVIKVVSLFNQQYRAFCRPRSFHQWMNMRLQIFFRNFHRAAGDRTDLDNRPLGLTKKRHEGLIEAMSKSLGHLRPVKPGSGARVTI